jgi:hypothetical protein
VRCRCRQVGSIFLSYIIHGVASGDHKVHLYSSDNGYALVALSTCRSRVTNDHEALQTRVTCVTAEVHEDLVETVQYGTFPNTGE